VVGQADYLFGRGTDGHAGDQAAGPIGSGAAWDSHQPRSVACRVRGYRLASVIAAVSAAALGATTPDAAPELLRQRRLERA